MDITRSIPEAGSPSTGPGCAAAKTTESPPYEDASPMNRSGRVISVNLEAKFLACRRTPNIETVP
jgi:hypothetical protein